MVELSFFGGVGEIGGNKIRVTSGESQIFLDFGKNFAREKEYFEEPFLSPREFRHLIHLGILPDLPGIYKGDESTPPPNAVVLSHAHTDHYDSIRFLKDEIPIMGSKMTGNLILAREYCGQAQVGEFIAKFTKGNGRQCCKTFDEIGSKPIKVGNFEIAQHPVDHSIPGARGTTLDDGETRVVYTGDIRFHGPRAKDSMDFLEFTSSMEPDVLIVEGTGMQGSRMNREEDVNAKAMEVVDHTNGLVLAGYPVFDFDRMSTFASIAEDTGRKLAVSMKQAFALLHLESKGIRLPFDLGDLAVFERCKKGSYAYEDEVANACSDVLTAEDVNRRQEKMIITFTLFDMNESIDIDPKPGSAYILSSSEPFSEEMWISYDRLRNWLKYLGIPLYQVHASGHARPHDIKEMVKRISPKVVVPIHTECPELFNRYLSDLDVEVLIPSYKNDMRF